MGGDLWAAGEAPGLMSQSLMTGVGLRVEWRVHPRPGCRMRQLSAGVAPSMYDPAPHQAPTVIHTCP